MYVVGLTGGIGAGKSEAAKMFANIGVPVVDVDVISRNLTSAGKPLVAKIAEAFGQEYVTADGAMDRAKIRDRIFSSDADRRLLESILHPAIHTEALRELDSYNNAPYQILAIPLFFESNRYEGIVNRTLLIDCTEDKQISRVADRNGFSEKMVRSIIATQASRSFRRALANDIIDNNGTLDELQANILQIHEKFIQACIVSE
ncbi:dephospho-CoA kinase [Methylobacillus gramineus]|uniref:dephospho-CoA kinase n=1 Tax=Methylobacillus gramineus TaxID=755169 RepID=UPI001CFFEA3D|nr:dephospho-CoA kinase [Methylobacillus gramineus]MCB5186249.1 dephospho-CoA kinase [Methylobacillus gramineus]